MRSFGFFFLVKPGQWRTQALIKTENNYFFFFVLVNDFVCRQSILRPTGRRGRGRECDGMGVGWNCLPVLVSESEVKCSESEAKAKYVTTI